MSPAAMQLDLFARPVAPAMRERCIPHGPVVQGAVDETLRLPHPKYAWDWAAIELHRASDGRWMWSTSYNTGSGGGGYRVGEKWGNFAPERDDALHWAIQELRALVQGRHLHTEERRPVRLILDWLDDLR
ncbi:MAG: hypothetical protein EON59_01375 [Alphaproteobacteria bacterium]|nr:MAG: hypothetical protein EON59_01375 [Alphaproteobacteria bacterium]